MHKVRKCFFLKGIKTPSQNTHPGLGTKCLQESEAWDVPEDKEVAGDPAKHPEEHPPDKTT